MKNVEHTHELPNKKALSLTTKRACFTEGAWLTYAAYKNGQIDLLNKLAEK